MKVKKKRMRGEEILAGKKDLKKLEENEEKP